MIGINNKLISFDSELIYVGDISGLVEKKAMELVKNVVTEFEKKQYEKNGIDFFRDFVVVYNWSKISTNYVSVNLYAFEK